MRLMLLGRLFRVHIFLEYIFSSGSIMYDLETTWIGLRPCGWLRSVLRENDGSLDGLAKTKLDLVDHFL